ncbi:hypothetical protein FACS189465_2320 [Clostridia bacterium]|nr:hypothetical protein FACS189465_2320 [Clostridia bacterium]
MSKFFGKFVYAFTPINGDDKAHGNPALVVFGDPNENEIKLISTESKIKLNGELMALPIIAFVKEIGNNEYNIKYRFCTGMPINICGHGTVAAAKAIAESKNITTKSEIIFHLEQCFKENRKFPTIKVETDGYYFNVNFQSFTYSKPHSVLTDTYFFSFKIQYI